MSRSGRISDLSDLVDQAKASRGGSGNPPPPSSRSVGPARTGGPARSVPGPSDARSLPPAGAGAGASDDASMSSFSRSVARVVRDSDAHSAAGASSGRGGPSRRPSGSSSSRSSSRSSSGRGSSRRSGGAASGSAPSDATDRLMSLVGELSRPRGTPGGGGSVASSGGYLPSQYGGRGGDGGGRSPPGSVRSRVTPVPPPSPGPGSVSGGSSAYSRRSSGVSAYTGTSGISSARNSRRTPPGSVGGGSRASAGGSDPVGYAMPPQYAPGTPPQYAPAGGSASVRSGEYTRDSARDSASEGQGGGSQYSYGSQTSAGQSTMPTEYTRTGFPDSTFVGGPMGPDPSADGSLAGSQMGSQMDGSYASGSQQNSYMSGSQQNSYMSGSQQNSYMSGSQQESYMSGSQQESYMSGSQQDSYASGSQLQNPYMTGAPAGTTAGMPVPGVTFASQASGQSHGGMNPYAVAPYHLGDPSDRSYAPSTQSSRSLANSAAIIPKARFSWASESLGAQSTIMTGGHRSLNTASVPEPQLAQRDGGKVTEGRIWASFAWILTFFIPNKCIARPTKDAKQAWREKVALFVTMVSCSTFFVGVFGFVPLLLCKEDTVFSMQDIWLQTGENWVVVHGTIYDVKDLIYKHPGGVKGIVDYLGKDGSKVFPRAPPVTLPEKCLDMEKVVGYNLAEYTPENNFTNPTCASFSELDVLLGITCHTFAAGSNGTAKFLGDYERGILSHTTIGLNEEGLQWFALYDRVYDVTNYIKAINENREPTVGDDEGLDNNPAAWLTPTLNRVIMNSLGGDATELYEALFGSSEYIACLEEMFYHGLLDDQYDTFCATLNIMMYCMLVFVALLMVVQFLASMIYVCPRHRTYSEEDVMSPVMIMVPCYNEGDNELRKTIKSVLNTTYPDENKVLFMVADGLVTGNGEDMSTPEHLANILGFDIDEFEDDTFEYDCIGVIHTKNRARVYHGILQKGHKFLKYISIVKCGLPEEATTTAKPGNRGKRDSQLIVMGYYNRIHYGRELTELDSAIQRAMVDLNLQADMVRFLMAIDADTRVDTMSITHMVYGMDKKEKVLALCGETKVDNKASSWVTMIQVFEYYNSHHLKKAFEAAFGCVTCLPGCFTMYRIIADDGTPLLPADGVLYEYSRNDVETLHEKNLYHLGEDRMLTTLLLKYFPDRSLTFIPEAACWTIVPHTFRILLSQRRRWINSTVHNMFELLKVNTMCGVCCVSMKVVVFIDLVATMILPASYVYAMYLLFLVFFEDLPVSTVLLILYGIIMGVQVVVFILRSRWEYVWWFFIYFTIGLPVFYLILPTYSFWNMDDFSWGKTRAVGGSGVANAGGEEGDDGDEDDDEDSDYSDEDDEDDETAALTRRSGATGRSRGSQRSGSRPSGARFRDEDESSSEEESSDEEESEDDETEYSRSMADQNDYYSQASRSRFSSPR